MNSLFGNVGRQIKFLATLFLWVGWVLSLVGCVMCFTVAIMNNTVIMVLIGCLILIGGILFSWLNSVFVYGFGALVENSEIIARNTSEYSESN